jgi:N utilization substance protein B
VHDRTRERKRALDVLHAGDVTGRAPLEVLALDDEPIGAFARRLVTGFAQHAEEIDGLIRSYADRWPLERMPVVDRNLLRIAIYELLYEPGTPPGAAINEAVELAKLLSTEDSGRFVNGLLGRLARERGLAS